MPQTMVTVQQNLDTLVHHPQQLANIHALDRQAIQQRRPWRHFTEVEATAQGDIQTG
ncbi:hypothetical protein D3C81_2315340 [compost metagenome]